jgi:Hsp20/alpha crystallin family protein
MSRMTLLQGEIWFGVGGPDRALPNLVRAPEAGYPPYNIEVLAEGDGTRNVLRTTLAVAGFSVDELAVTVEDGQLVVRAKQLEERAPDYLYRASRPTFQAEVRARRRGSRCAILSCTMACSPSSLSGRSRRRRSRQCGIVNGETASKTREVFKPKRATVSDAE